MDSVMSAITGRQGQGQAAYLPRIIGVYPAIYSSQFKISGEGGGDSP